VFRDEKGNAKKEIMDLTEIDGRGKFKRDVIKTLDPFKYHIDISQYFFSRN
jgi:hypothetical protein